MIDRGHLKYMYLQCQDKTLRNVPTGAATAIQNLHLGQNMHKKNVLGITC